MLLYGQQGQKASSVVRRDEELQPWNDVLCKHIRLYARPAKRGRAGITAAPFGWEARQTNQFHSSHPDVHRHGDLSMRVERSLDFRPAVMNARQRSKPSRLPAATWLSLLRHNSTAPFAFCLRQDPFVIHPACYLSEPYRRRIIRVTTTLD